MSEAQPTRDTQFAGFAKLLPEDMKPDLTMLFTEMHANYPSNSPKGIEEAEEIIKQHLAQRAYDLVRHAVEHAMLTGMSLPGYIDKERYITHVMQAIPDMTEWPEEDKTLDRIACDVWRVMGDRPVVEVATELLSKHNVEDS